MRQKNVFRRVWASFKSWKLAPSYGLLKKLSCRKSVSDDDSLIEEVVVQPSTVEFTKSDSKLTFFNLFVSISVVTCTVKL